jgi:hypothetical protein
LAIIFREFREYAIETRIGKSCEIMADCRSFPGFQMMELAEKMKILLMVASSFFK